MTVKFTEKPKYIFCKRRKYLTYFAQYFIFLCYDKIYGKEAKYY